VLAYNMLETLVYWDSQALEVKPGLATRGNTPTISRSICKLRDDVTFHDGQKLTADTSSIRSRWSPAMAWQAAVEPEDALQFHRRRGEDRTYSVRLHFGRIAPLALPQIATSLWIVPHEYHARVGATEFGHISSALAVSRRRGSNRTTACCWSATPATMPPAGANLRSPTSASAMIPNCRRKSPDDRRPDRLLWRLPSDQAQRLARVKEVVVAYGGTTHGAPDHGWPWAGPAPGQSDVARPAGVVHAVIRRSRERNLIGNGAQLLTADCHPRQFGCRPIWCSTITIRRRRSSCWPRPGLPNGFDISSPDSARKPFVLQAIQAISPPSASAPRSISRIPMSGSRIITGGKLPFTFTIWSNLRILDARPRCRSCWCDPGVR